MHSITNIQHSPSVGLPPSINFHTVTRLGNWLLIISMSFFIVSVLVSYPFAALFNIPQQIAAHIGTMVFPAFIKIGYVVRCIGIYGLGKRV